MRSKTTTTTTQNQNRFCCALLPLPLCRWGGGSFSSSQKSDRVDDECLNHRIGNQWSLVVSNNTHHRRREMMTSTTLKEENVLDDDDDDDVNDDDFDETKKNAKTTTPSLRTRMRHLAKLVHPDALGPNVPKECKDNNQSALAELNGVLDSITKEKKFPKTGVKRLKFYYIGRSEEKRSVVAKRQNDEEKVEDDDSDDDDDKEEEELVLRAAKFMLKTNGGDCRNVLKQSLQSLFAEVLETKGSRGGGHAATGSSSCLGDFTWEASDWANEGTKEEQERERFYEERRRQTEEYERMVEQRKGEDRMNSYSGSNSSGSNASQATSSSRSSEKEMKREQRRHEKLQEDLKNMDPLFEGIAFVPWLPENEAGRSRKQSVAKEVVPKLQKNGWDLKKESLKEVWRGLRDRAVLLKGLDGASAAAMHAILKHSEIAEKQLGPPTMKRSDTFEWFD